MPFNGIGLSHMPTWPTKARSKTHSRRSTVDLRSVSDDFGIPGVDDPDPFGVLALEKAGFEIKEAGTHSRPSSDTFEFHPSPTSPLFRHSFQSLDGVSKRASRRDSKRSLVSVDQGTQTADLPSPSEERDSIWSGHTRQGSQVSAIEDKGIEAWSASVGKAARVHDEADFTGMDGGQGREVASPRTSLGRVSRSLIPSTEMPILEEAEPAESPSPISPEPETASPVSTVNPKTTEPEIKANRTEEQLEDEPEPIVAQVVQAGPAIRMVAQQVTSPTLARAKLVTIRGRPAPAVPVRNPARVRRVKAVSAQSAEYTEDDSRTASSTASSSPTRSGFDQPDDYSSPWSDQTSLPDMEKSAPPSKRSSFDTRSKDESSDKTDETAAPKHTSPLAAIVSQELSTAEDEPTQHTAEVKSNEIATPEITSSASDRNSAGEGPDLAPSASSLSEPPAPRVDVAQTEEKTAGETVAKDLEVMTRSMTPEAADAEESTIDSPTSSLAGQEHVEDMVKNQSALLAPEPEIDVSDAASISDYGDDDIKEKEKLDDDETSKSDTFHSMPTSPHDVPATNPIDVPEVPAPLQSS